MEYRHAGVCGFVLCTARKLHFSMQTYLAMRCQCCKVLRSSEMRRCPCAALSSRPSAARRRAQARHACSWRLASPSSRPLSSKRSHA